MAAWSGFVRTVHQLYMARFLPGVAEAGYYPGILLYLTYWFGQREQAQAIALFMTGIPITNVLGGPISGLILDHVHWLGKQLAMALDSEGPSSRDLWCSHLLLAA